MALMRLTTLGCLVAMATACGPSMAPDHVKSVDEQIADQEKTQTDTEKEGKFKQTAEIDTKEIDEEQKQKFDQRQAELELKRQTRSAETCPGAIGSSDKEQPKGEGEVSLIFGNNGHVKSASIGPPFTDTKVGECALNAFKSAIVPPFVGPEQPMTWKVDLSKVPEAKKDKDKKEPKKK
jgi:hypothetical protein